MLDGTLNRIHFYDTFFGAEKVMNLHQKNVFKFLDCHNQNVYYHFVANIPNIGHVFLSG